MELKKRLIFQYTARISLEKFSVCLPRQDDFDDVMKHLASEGGRVRESDMTRLIFGDYMDVDLEPEECLYEEVESLDKMSACVETYLREFNNTSKNKMNLVIFQYVLEHLSHICRILRSPGGHALLVGVGGSGRQSLTRLAAMMAGFSLFQPEISKNYGKPEWREDIKTLMRQAGKGTPVVFLLTDSQIKQESFLEDVDNLLNSGEVPNLFASDERAEVLENLIAQMNAAKQSTEGLTQLALFSIFINKCRENIHIIVAFSPIGAAFRVRLRQFPSIVNCCTIDWFQNWPEEGLYKVAVTNVNSFKKQLNISDEDCESYPYIFMKQHTKALETYQLFFENMGRKNYVTPTSYLQLIASFKELITKKQEEIIKAKNRYLNGLDKLAFAASQVRGLQLELEALQPQLKISSEENEKMMKVWKSFASGLY